ncbi:MAG: hypothetical protein MJ162_00270 [Treponema sp.]|nr:hypothetical protein [Treponema sp.]
MHDPAKTIMDGTNVFPSPLFAAIVLSIKEAIVKEKNIILNLSIAAFITSGSEVKIAKHCGPKMYMRLLSTAPKINAYALEIIMVLRILSFFPAP